MTPEEAALNLLNELFGHTADTDTEDVEVVYAGEVTVEQLHGFLDGFLDDVFNLPLPAAVPPRRGSAPYREAIEAVAELEEMERLINALHILWNDYGWRGPLDVMAEWVLQIEGHPNTAPQNRDMFGVVDLGTIVMLAPDDEQLLHIAAEQSRNPQFNDHLAPHQAFSEAMRLSERASQLGSSWLPSFRAAFTEAHTHHERHPQGISPDARSAVFAALFKGPGRADQRDLLQVALLLGAAAMAIRNRQEMAANFARLKKQRVVSNAEVNPRWRANYYQRPS